MFAGRGRKPYSNRMEVHVTSETAKTLNDLATTSGRDIVDDEGTQLLRRLPATKSPPDLRAVG